MRIIRTAGCMTKHIPEKGDSAPRVRENLDLKYPHNSGYAGGKILRKRMARLAARTRAQEETRSDLRRKPKAVPENAFRMPSSMK